MDFSVYDHTLSEESGESSRARNYNTLDTHTMKSLRIKDRASPVPFRANHQNTILKSKSGHSIKDFDKRQEL
jgi:hypothetical protein